MIFLIFIAILSTILIAYAAAVHHNGYWRRRGIDGPLPRPFVGNMGEWFRRMPLSLQLYKWTKQYGKVYGVQEGWMNVFVTSDVQLLHEVFVTKFEYFHGRKISPTTGNVDTLPRVDVFSARGSRWKRLRSIANSLFSVNNLKGMLPIIHDSVSVMMQHFEEKGGRGQSIDFNMHFHELTMDVIMRVALGQKGTKQFDNVKHVQAISALFALSGATLWHYYGRITQPLLGGTIHHLSRYVNKLTNAPLASSMAFVGAEVQARKTKRDKKESGEQNDDDDNLARQVDFIDLFLEMETEKKPLYANGGSTFDKSVVKISKQMTVAEINAQCLSFLAAGFDTTANTLAITSHYLARHSDVQSRLREEFRAVCGDDENLTYEQINQLRYADAVIREALRLWPVGAAVCARICSKTTTLGPYTIEEGTVVQADVFGVQRDKAIWGKDADEFRPERWLKDGVSRSIIEWMPFGAGPRICVGLRLANLTAKMVLAKLLRTYKLHTTPDSEVRCVLKNKLPREIACVLYIFNKN